MTLQSFFRVFPLLFCLCFSTSSTLGAFAPLDTHPAPSTPTCASFPPAGLTCLMSQATISVANNGGDIGQILKDLSIKESIQNLAVSMISAGALQEISNKLQLPTHPQGWAGHLKHNALKQVVSAPLKMVIQGEKPSQVLRDGLQGLALDTMRGYVSEGLGQSYKSGKIDYVTHKLGHGLLGGLTGLALDRHDPGRGFTSGVMGGMASEVLSEALYDVVPASDLSERVERTSSLAQLGTGVLALLADQNVGVAVDVAQNALTHNFIPSMLSGGDGALMAEAESLQEMLEDESLDATLLKLGFIPAMNAEGTLGYQLGETFYATAESAFLSYLTHNPMLNVAMQRFLERPDMAAKIAQGRWLEYFRPTSEVLQRGMQVWYYGQMMGKGFVLGAVAGGTVAGPAGGVVGGIVGLYGGYQTAVLTEYVVGEISQQGIDKLANQAERMYPGSGEQLIYETMDIVGVLMPYRQAGRGLMKLHPGKVGGRTGRWLPKSQRHTTPWDHLVPTSLHTWTDAFFGPQLQLTLAPGGFGGGKTSGLLLHNTQKPTHRVTPGNDPGSISGTTFKMDSKGFGSDRSGKRSSAPGKADIASGTTPQLSTAGKVDTAPKPAPRIQRTPNNSPQNFITHEKYKKELQREADLREKVIKNKKVEKNDPVETLGFRGEEIVKSKIRPSNRIEVNTQRSDSPKEFYNQMVKEFKNEGGIRGNSQTKPFSTQYDQSGIETVFDDGSRIILRNEGKSGHPKVEITDVYRNIYEKITFFQDTN